MSSYLGICLKLSGTQGPTGKRCYKGNICSMGVVWLGRPANRSYADNRWGSILVGNTQNLTSELTSKLRLSFHTCVRVFTKKAQNANAENHFFIFSEFCKKLFIQDDGTATKVWLYVHIAFAEYIHTLINRWIIIIIIQEYDKT